MKLLSHSYGKARIRVVKVTRGDRQHSLKELDISVMLDGKFDASYTAADNGQVVPTDTIRNIVNILAKEKLEAETEPFGVVVGKHFLEKYAQVEQVQVRLLEGCWERIAVRGRPHEHSFIQRSPVKHFAEVTSSRMATSIQSGVSDLLILKTTQSGFEGYDTEDPCTTLLETKDRILATQLRACWTYGAQPASYLQSNARIVDSMLEVFASNYSPSVQATLFEMGGAALQAVPEIAKITLSMPNKHCVRIDLAPFGVENDNELFLPTDEPHGQIEGTVSRE